MTDKSVIGKVYPSFVYEVEKVKIKELAEAIEDENPLYRNEEAARASKHGSLIAPPTFPTLFRSEEWGIMDMLNDLKVDISKLLHGEQEYEYFRLIKPGDKLTCTTRIKDIYTKEGKSGSMDMITTETDCVDERGELVTRARALLVVRN